MADNYLEKRMDDYRNGRLSAVRKNSKLTPGGNRSGRVGFQLEVSRVFVALECRQLCEAISKGYAEAGYRVAFCGSDRIAGTENAQRFGLMFCPVDRLSADRVNRMKEVVEKRWHGIDLIITDIPGISFGKPSKLLVVTSSDRYAELHDLYQKDCSGVIYKAPDSSRLPEKAVKLIVGNALLQGCNADVDFLTELKF